MNESAIPSLGLKLEVWIKLDREMKNIANQFLR